VELRPAISLENIAVESLIGGLDQAGPLNAPSNGPVSKLTEFAPAYGAGSNTENL